MTTINASTARAKLYRLIEETVAAHEPVTITGKHANVVLIGEEDWQAIQETLFLTGIPGMRDSIVKGMKTPVEKCGKELNW